MSYELTRWQRFVHKFMGWHKPSRSRENWTFDGASFGSRCRVCGVRVLLDSQGNWFKVGP